MPCTGADPVTGASVSEPTGGSEPAGSASAGPLPATPAIVMLVAFATLHDRTGVPPGSLCTGVKRNALIDGRPPDWMRFWPPGRHGGQVTIGVPTLPKPRPQISPTAPMQVVSSPVTFCRPPKFDVPPWTKPTQPALTPAGSVTSIAVSVQRVTVASRQPPPEGT